MNLDRNAKLIRAPTEHIELFLRDTENYIMIILW